MINFKKKENTTFKKFSRKLCCVQTEAATRGVPTNFEKFWLRSATLLKKKLWHRYFPVNFAKLFRTFFTEHLRVIASMQIQPYNIWCPQNSYGILWKSCCDYCKILNCKILSRRKSLLHRNQFIDLLCKPMDWFLYHRDLRHERVNVSYTILWILYVMRRDKTWDSYLESNHLF